MIRKILYKILLFLGIISEEEVNKSFSYKKKKIMTEAEITFYKKIKELEKDYEIIPQVNLASIIKKEGKVNFHNELFRNIDFAIFSKNFEEILLLIELNDKSHEKYKRKDRDLKVKKICNDAEIKLINFYTKYPNEKDYVINRIKNEIELNRSGVGENTPSL